MSLPAEHSGSAELDQGPLGPVKEIFLPLADQVLLIDVYRYCRFTEKDPLITFKEIWINVLYISFDWLLTVRKDSIGAARTL